MTTILWVDDEIGHLQSHIRYLEKRGYRVLTATSGREALEILASSIVDLVLMDQMMVGMDGLETVDSMRRNHHTLPVVMVTQSEEEELMDKAIGGSVDDYLTKPVNPSQILLVIKRLLMGGRLRTQKAARDIADQTSRVLDLQGPDADWRDWVEVYRTLVEKDVASEGTLTDEMKSIQKARMDDLAMGFSRLVESRFPDWIATSGDDAPVMSHTFLERVVKPRLGTTPELVLLVMDCMGYDQWLTIERTVDKWFTVDAGFMMTILPSSTTGRCRNRRPVIRAMHSSTVRQGGT